MSSSLAWQTSLKNGLGPSIFGGNFKLAHGESFYVGNWDRSLGLLSPFNSIMFRVAWVHCELDQFEYWSLSSQVWTSYLRFKFTLGGILSCVAWGVSISKRVQRI